MASAHTSLATKWRPQTWDEVCGQSAVVQILKHQLETGTFKQAYLFCGKYGSGKTTSARLMARGINKGTHGVIEIDAASNNGADHVRAIAKDSHAMSVVSDYKVFILDEAHLTSAAGWGVWLKLLEEPPSRSIFIFCTTDPQKIPNTILSRVQQYNFTNIPLVEIASRLKFIAEQENIDIDDSSINYIAKMAEGSMRDGIAMLDKCQSLNTKITMKEVADTLSTVGYKEYLTLIDALCRKDSKTSVSIIANAYNNGKDMKLFIEQLLYTVCDVCNYFIFNSFEYISIPELPEYKEMMDTLNMTDCLAVLEWVKRVNSSIRGNKNPKNAIVVEVMLWTQNN